MKKILATMMMTAALASCNDCEELEKGDHPDFMQVNVSTAQVSRALHTGTALGDNESIGVFVLDAAGKPYDNITEGYTNARCTSDGEGSSQKWEFDTPILFSSTQAKALAYYPWKETCTDYTALPLETATQTDYMYCGWVGGLSNAAPHCSFVLSHALTAIRLSVKRGSYSGAGTITDITIRSDALATEGTLDAGAASNRVSYTDGTQGTEVTVLGGGTASLYAKDADECWEHEYMFVPTGEAAPIIIRLKMDGTWYKSTVNVTAETDGQDTFSMGMPLSSGVVYVISMTAENTALVTEGVTINTWETVEEQGGDLIVE